jgi:hypothetical protein
MFKPRAGFSITSKEDFFPESGSEWGKATYHRQSPESFLCKSLRVSIFWYSSNAGAADYRMRVKMSADASRGCFANSVAISTFTRDRICMI